MEASADQTSILKQRIRRLERALTESEALTLAQIECTKRLEQQLQEQQVRLDAQDRDGQGSAATPSNPTGAGATDPDSAHIQELQDLIWELERRPTLEQHQLLKQQCENHLIEIETLKSELHRRPDPVRIFELQQEIAILKEYTQQLTDRSTNVIQVQQKYLELRSQYSELETELERLRQLAKGSEESSALHNRNHELEILLTGQGKELAYVLAELDTCKQHIQEKAAENAALTARLQELEHKGSSFSEQLSHWQAANQQLTLELASTRYELEQLRHDQVDLSEYRAVQDRCQHLQAQLETLQALQKEQNGELQQLKLERVANQYQVDELKLRLAARDAEHHDLQLLRDQLEQERQALTVAQTTLQRQHEQIESLEQHVHDLEQQLTQLPTEEQWRERLRHQELIEAHQVVNQKQIEKMQQRILELQTECVQAHAYAQSQEKEVAILEEAKQDLELRLLTLQAQRSQPTSPAAPAVSPGVAPSPLEEEGIPPFAVDSEVPPLPTRTRLSVAAAGPMAGSVAGSGNGLPPTPVTPVRRVELPAFVRRR
ncbi:MAG: hypothetical protein OHK0012_05480 [Synechococcales cyanobacterium]